MKSRAVRQVHLPDPFQSFTCWRFLDSYPNYLETSRDILVSRMYRDDPGYFRGSPWVSLFSGALLLSVTFRGITIFRGSSLSEFYGIFPTFHVSLHSSLLLGEGG